MPQFRCKDARADKQCAFSRDQPPGGQPSELSLYGDNLTMLHDHVDDESVDLIYLDPPFNSQQDFNIFFKECDGKRSMSQERVFQDTWEWKPETSALCDDLEHTGGKLSEVIRAFRSFLGDSDMMAYLVMMAPRLQELRRVLKPTGSVYLHCDPNASHYLKMLMDAIFGPEQFRNEIIWRRTRGHNDTKLTRFGAVHDVILFYSKSKDRRFNRTYTERPGNTPTTHDLYRHTDGQLYRKGDCRAPGGRGPRYEWNGYVRNWRFTEDEKRRLENEGRIVFSKTGMPRVLRPVDLKKGSALQDVWVDIDAPNSGADETLGYPTQKPEALLERIVQASSNEGDAVLDPFCGCGTSIHVAQRLHRRWIGIDITQLAIGIIKQRLAGEFGSAIFRDITILGEPITVSDAETLARTDKFGFQCWAVSKLGAPPLEHRKGADRGIDGRLYFSDGPGADLKQIIVSVKAGEHLTPAFVRELRGVVEREHAAMGILVCVKNPTSEMKREAANAGMCRGLQGNFPRIQIATIDHLLGETPLKLPQLVNPWTVKKPVRVSMDQQLPLIREAK